MGERDHDFREWLRHTIGRLNRHETTVLEDSIARPRYDDPDVERRIVNLINRIAEEPKRKRADHSA